MNGTKEMILQTALRLFARDGYEAVSVSTLAGELGMTKGALYKHYENKHAIFDSIVARMEQNDADQARTYEVPEGTLSQQESAYAATSLESIRAFTAAQFRYWTEESFSASFRRLLTLEQYRDKEMAELYQQYLASGPLEYLADLFGTLAGDQERGQALALAFYGPMFLLYSVYDAGRDPAEVKAMLEKHMDRFLEQTKLELQGKKDKKQ